MSEYGVYYSDDVRVEFVALGEGRDGDYNPDDPNDVELLRFDVYVRWDEPEAPESGFVSEGIEWASVDDGSYCCGIPVDATEEQKQAALKWIHDHIGNPPRKHAMEAVSWIALNPDGTLFTQSAEDLLKVT